MKKSIFIRLTALLLAILIGLFLPACSALPENNSQEVTDAYLPVAEETETATQSKSDDKSDANRPQAPPTEKTTEKSTGKSTSVSQTSGKTKSQKIDENGRYDSKDEVALYIHTYGHLPANYITKKQAESKGWSGGSLKDYAPGCCIGGDRFGNYEGLLPKAKGRTYTECDIGTMNAKSRGAKRIIFSNDGLIYYTDNHYESFTRLY